MKIRIQEYTGNAFALNPRIERSSNQLVLRFDEQACTHFLIFSHAPDKNVNLADSHLQELLWAKGETLLQANHEPLTDDLSVRCVSYREYRMNNYAINLMDRIAGYTIFGCQFMRQYDPEQFNIVLPQEHMCCSVNVSVEVPYRINFCPEGEGRRGAQAFYVVQFEDVPNYQDGGIVYTLENLSFQFPITRKMLGGQRLYIDAGMGAPKFMTTVSGLNLKKI